MASGVAWKDCAGVAPTSKMSHDLVFYRDQTAATIHSLFAEAASWNNIARGWSRPRRLRQTPRFEHAHL